MRLGGRPAAADQIAEALNDDTAAQHVAQPGDGFAVTVGIFEGLREVLRHQQGEVGVLGLLGGIFIAVAVDGDDAVGVLIDHGALGVHAEGTDTVAVLLGAVDDLAFVQLVSQMGKDGCGQFHADAEVHAVGLGGDLQIPADGFHPLAADAAHGNDALLAAINGILADHVVAVLGYPDGLNRGVKEEGDLLLQISVQIFQNDIVDIGAQMTDGSVQQMQVVLDAQGLEPGTGGRIQLGAFAAVAQIDLVHVLHQIQGLLLADVFVKGTAKIIGDVVLTVGEGACAAETAHDGAALAADTGLDLHTVDGTTALGQSMARFEDGDFQTGIPLHQLIGCENTAGTGTNDDNIILHNHCSCEKVLRISR